MIWIVLFSSYIMMKDFKERKVKNKNCHIPTEVVTWNLMGIIKHIPSDTGNTTPSRVFVYKKCTGINNGCSINFINRLWQLEDSRWLLEALFSSLHDGSPYGNWWLPPTPFSKCMHQWAFTKCSFLWGAFTHIATPQHTNWQESISRIHWL